MTLDNVCEKLPPCSFSHISPLRRKNETQQFEYNFDTSGVKNCHKRGFVACKSYALQQFILPSGLCTYFPHRRTPAQCIGVDSRVSFSSVFFMLKRFNTRALKFNKQVL